MKSRVLTYLILLFICVLGSGCATSMAGSNVGISPTIPRMQQPEDNIIPQDNNSLSSGTDQLSEFIRAYNKTISGNESVTIADCIIKVSNRYGIDYKVITALIAIESGFRSSARSPSGALGLGQLMPSTARGLKVSNPFNPADNLNGTVKLLRTHLEKYNGNINFALAAYKMGAGTVNNYGITQPATANYIKNIRRIFDRVP